MKFKNTLITVKNIDISVGFYRKALGLRVISDFGANKTLTGGLSLQTEETWREFIEGKDIIFGSNSSELYFEEADFDSFIKKLDTYENINYVHRAKTHDWGQRVVRFYDPDMHIIEVGEDLKSVCIRFSKSGLSDKEISEKMGVPQAFVESCLK